MMLLAGILFGCASSEAPEAPRAKSKCSSVEDMALRDHAAGPRTPGSEAPRNEAASSAERAEAEAESAESEVVWEADMEAGGLFPPYSDGVEEGNGSLATIDNTDAPDSDGRAIRLTMPASRGSEANVPKRKFLDVPNLSWSPGAEYWYGIRLYFDENWELSEIRDNRDQFTSLLSFRYADADINGTGSVKLVQSDLGAPCLVHTRAALSADEYGDGAGEDPLYLGPVIEEEWIELVCHFKWSHTAENALKECWRDGTWMGRSTRQNMSFDATVSHRVGIYEGPGVDHERTLYWDDHRIGRSHQAVAADR